MMFTSDEISTWKVNDVVAVMEVLLESKFSANAFQEHQINGVALLELTAEDLKGELRLPLGHAKVVLKFIADAKARQTITVFDVEVLKPEEPKQIDPTENKIATEATSVLRPGIPKTSLSPNLEVESSAALALIPPDKFTEHKTVKATLLQHAHGQFLEPILTHGPISENDRKAVVRILVSELITAQKSFYPPSESLQALASALVREYPLLKDNSKQRTFGFEHFYDPNTKQGFFVFRLWTVQKTLKPDQKKYRRTADNRKTKIKMRPAEMEKEYLLSDDDNESKISCMEMKLPFERNKKAIRVCLEETFPNRLNWIAEKSPTVTEVFSRYPRLLDYQGEMIDQEFVLHFPKSEDKLLAVFPTQYTEKILGYAARYRPDLLRKLSSLIGDENLRALILLSALLPVSNSSRVAACGRGRGAKQSRQDYGGNQERSNATATSGSHLPNPDLMLVLPEGTNKSVTEEKHNAVQLCLMWVQGQEHDACFVQGDGWFIRPRDPVKTPLAAFDTLFKIYHVFQVHYPFSLQNFFNFLECYVYGINDNPLSSVSSLHVNITNFKDDTELTTVKQG